MKKGCVAFGIVLVVGVAVGVVIVLVVLPASGLHIVSSRTQQDISQPLQSTGPAESFAPTGDQHTASVVPDEPGRGADWDYATVLLDQHGSFSETEVAFQGKSYTNSLRQHCSPGASRDFFWMLAELPASYAQKTPVRLEGTFGVGDASHANAAFQFEIRLNNGAPQTYQVKLNVPATMSVDMTEVYRIDIRATNIGEGYGQAIIVEPKLYFR